MDNDINAAQFLVDIISTTYQVKPTFPFNSLNKWEYLKALSQRIWKLSDRKADIIILIMKGYENAEIARLLYVSPETINKHLDEIFRQSNINKRSKLLPTLLEFI